ncbi:response regulator transcription factor [Acuticoccus sp. I52.16.1]|uniref:response regulator transcription factor n=1 Tax=Acuticoccus sp. I52.16.1 TaxID=2928472 RepID=UPI001FD61431|nr:response regulator transcription factor [Acuticoccus sp. I52.16.1]UOM32769.1 response regulator transcription factor [Acuticoccus sp. I52.16.1]
MGVENGYAGTVVADSALVLVVEDEPAVQDLVAQILTREKFRVATADSVRAAEKVLESEDVVLALVDLTLRDGNGLDLVRRLSLDPTVGTIILSGAADDMDRIIGLEVGADDYVTKPFNNRELAARLRRHAARIQFIREQANHPPVANANGHAPKSEGPSLGPWAIDEARRAVYHESGARAALSDAEFRTLICLFRNQGTVLSRDGLYHEVVGPGSRDPLDRRIDVYVSGLRKKLNLTDPHRIRTVHGVGYILD